MSCKNCKSERIADLYAKCSDRCVINVGDREHVGYVPDDAGIGGGDDVEFEYCLDCGMIQGDWPLDPMELETDGSDES